MVCELSRREILRLMMIALPANFFGFWARNYFDEELVCVHVYDLAQALPEPLLQRSNQIEKRFKNKEYFQIGLPELILCRTKMKLIDMFSYFWPVSRPEIKRLQGSITIEFKKPVIEDINDLADFQKILENLNDASQDEKGSLALILTLNNYTKHMCPLLMDICHNSGGIEELVIFKDPSRPPYLCTYPSQQKGFKRPPPYSASRLRTRIATREPLGQDTG